MKPDWEQQLKYYGGMPRLAEVEELGGAYVYLLSDAASYTTSIDIPVNGVIGSKCRRCTPSKEPCPTKQANNFGSLLTRNSTSENRHLSRGVSLRCAIVGL